MNKTKYIYLLIAIFYTSCVANNEQVVLNLEKWKKSEMSDIECFNLNYDLEKSKIRFSQLDLIIDTLSIGMHRERIIKLLGNGDTCNFEKNRSSQSFEIEKGKGLARISDIYYYNLSDTTIPYAVNFNGSSIDYLVLKLDDDTLSTIYFARGF